MLVLFFPRSKTTTTHNWSEAISSGGIEWRFMPGQKQQSYLDYHPSDTIAGTHLSMSPTPRAHTGLYKQIYFCRPPLFGTFSSAKSPGHGPGIGCQTPVFRRSLDEGCSIFLAVEFPRSGHLAGRSLEWCVCAQRRPMGISSTGR